MTASIRTVPQLLLPRKIQLEHLSRGQRGTSLKSKVDNFRHVHTPGGAITRPCLTDAAPEAAPGELFVEEAATRRPEHQRQRSLRQSASVVSYPPLYST